MSWRNHPYLSFFSLSKSSLQIWLQYPQSKEKVETGPGKHIFVFETNNFIDIHAVENNGMWLLWDCRGFSVAKIFDVDWSVPELCIYIFVRDQVVTENAMMTKKKQLSFWLDHVLPTCRHVDRALPTQVNRIPLV